LYLGKQSRVQYGSSILGCTEADVPLSQLMVRPQNKKILYVPEIGWPELHFRKLLARVRESRKYSIHFSNIRPKNIRIH
jgi:hypothetical protein